MELATASEDSEYVLVRRSAINNLLSSFAPTPAIFHDFDPSVFLAEFKQACEIDYHLRPLTITEHMRHAKRLLKFLDKHPLQATRRDLREFLALNPPTNAIKAVRVLYGRFLESDLASCFKVPQSPLRVMIVPTREQLKMTYDNLDDIVLEAAFLLFASSGLRRHELMDLIWARVDMENRIVYPDRPLSTTKFQWVTFFNQEAKVALERLFLVKSPSPNERVFTFDKDTLTRKFREASFPTSFKTTPQVLRDWFCNEMGRLGVPDRYIDAFCGRIPKSVLARHYTDYSPNRLKEIYDMAGLEIFNAFSSSSSGTASIIHSL